MSNVITDRVEISRCAQCGTSFGMQATLIEARRRDGLTFYCPNGHWLSFKGSPEQRAQDAEKERAALDTEVQRLIAENDRLRDELIEARHPSWSRRFIAGIRTLRRGSRP